MEIIEDNKATVIVKMSRKELKAYEIFARLNPAAAPDLFPESTEST